MWWQWVGGDPWGVPLKDELCLCPSVVSFLAILRSTACSAMISRLLWCSASPQPENYRANWPNTETSESKIKEIPLSFKLFLSGILSGII